jgi:hypothetical protein
MIEFCDEGGKPLVVGFDLDCRDQFFYFLVAFNAGVHGSASGCWNRVHVKFLQTKQPSAWRDAPRSLRIYR